MSILELVAVALLFRGLVFLLHRIVVWVALGLLWLYHCVCVLWLQIWHLWLVVWHHIH
jgi:hypothetical protein